MWINSSLVRERRTLKGWTQQQLADVTGLSLRTIQRVEVQANASIETVNALCATLEVGREDLTTPPGKARPPWYPMAALFALGALTGAAITLWFTGNQGPLVRAVPVWRDPGCTFEGKMRKK